MPKITIETDGLVSSDGNKHILQVEVRPTTDEQMVAMEAFIQATPEDRAKLLGMAKATRNIMESWIASTLLMLSEGGSDAPDGQ